MRHAPARSAQCSIQGIHPVGGPDHHHLPPCIQPIHECQQGGHNRVVDLILLAAAHLQQQVVQGGRQQEPASDDELRDQGSV